MKFIKSFAIGVAAALATATPSFAKVDEGTPGLLKALQENGIQVLINSNHCNGTIHGSYRTVSMKRTMVLCPGSSVDAIDHATVRHEAAHAVQHCVNHHRGTSRFTPIVDDIDALAAHVNEGVPEDVVDFIRTNYPQEHWLVEFEAAYIERNITAAQVEQWVRKACGDE